jgi:drug/metabolite transporter superfamily protein YnfA
MHAIKVNFRDLSLRFVLGGASVALCFVLLQLIPSKSFAGVFAAFPAIMAASVVMAGYFENSEQASDIALGASAGMVGCTICVLTASYCMEHLNKWGLSLIISLFVWFFSSYSTSQMMQIILEK